MLHQRSLLRSLSSLARGLEFELLFLSATGAIFFIIRNLEVRKKGLKRRLRERRFFFLVPLRSIARRGLPSLSKDPFVFSSRSPCIPRILCPSLSLFLTTIHCKQFGFRATSEL